MSLELRPLVDTDLDEMFVWVSEPRGVAMAAFTRADPSDRAAFDAHQARVSSNPDNTQLAITDDGALVGMIASFTIEGDRELTYWIDPSRWGQGVASRALVAFLDVETTRPLWARVAEHNVGSATVLGRAGFTQAGSDRGWAAGVGREVVEHIYRLD